jgi:multiple sugar transport system ATP-binding protein
MADLSILHLTKAFGSAVAVDDVSLDARDGEFAVLLGPSGSGKTTILRCLAGLETPDKGTVSIGGRDMTGVPVRDRGVSMVFQNYALFPLMKVRDNIGFPLRVRGTPKDEVDRKVSELASRLGIGNLLEKMPRQLSGGEQQRVSMARALIRETSAILMDEPLSSLDAPLRAQLRIELKALQRDFRRTVVYVTHDQVEAMTLADRIAVLKNGRLLQYDAPLRVYEHPTSPFVAGFVGSPPASILKLSVTSSGASVILRGQGVELLVPSAFEAVLRKMMGKEVILAVRAEGITVGPDPLQGLTGTIKLVEHLGASTIVDLTVGEFALRSLAAGTVEALQGAQVGVGIDFTRTSLFDPSTDTRLA